MLPMLPMGAETKQPDADPPMWAHVRFVCARLESERRGIRRRDWYCEAYNNASKKRPSSWVAEGSQPLRSPRAG